MNINILNDPLELIYIFIVAVKIVNILWFPFYEQEQEGPTEHEAHVLV